MVTGTRHLLLATAAALVAVGATAAQDIRPANQNEGVSVHRMEIINGPNQRSVHYFPRNTSPSEESALRELELTENEVRNAENMLALRRSFLNTQRGLEQQRQNAMATPYGPVLTPTLAITSFAPFATLNGNNGFFPTFGGPGGFGGAPITTYAPTVVPAVPSVAGGLVSPGALVNGFDDGPLRTALAAQLVQQGTPEYVTRAHRNYVHAQANAVSLLKQHPGQGDIRAVGPVDVQPVKARQVTLTLKNGDKMEGALLSEDHDWITVGTPEGQERIRPADVTRMLIKTPK